MSRHIVFRVIWALFWLAALVGVGVLAYNAGVTRGLADSGKLVVVPPAGGVAPYPYAAGPYLHYGLFGPGMGLLSCLALFLGFGLIFSLLRLALWRRPWGGPMGWGWHGHPGDFREWRRWEKGYPPIVEEWHRKMHTPDQPETPPADPAKV